MKYYPTKAPRIPKIVASIILSVLLSACAHSPYDASDRYYYNSGTSYIQEIIQRLFPGARHAPITSGYGNRIHPVTGLTQWHNGIDVGVPHKTMIASPKNGVIQQIYKHEDGGLTLKLKDLESGVVWGMCHLHKVLVDEGDFVRIGQPIALSGGDINDPNRGNSIGAHLHLTLRWNGHLVNPETFAL